MQILTANDPETHSSDLVSENIAQLHAFFPEAFTEGKIDFEMLKQLLGDAVEEQEEKYGLNWHHTREKSHHEAFHRSHHRSQHFPQRMRKSYPRSRLSSQGCAGDAHGLGAGSRSNDRGHTQCVG